MLQEQLFFPLCFFTFTAACFTRPQLVLEFYFLHCQGNHPSKNFMKKNNLDKNMAHKQLILFHIKYLCFQCAYWVTEIAMVLPKPTLLPSALLLLCMFSLLHSVHCDVNLKELSKGFNIYKNSLNQPPLIENSRAACISEKIAKDLYNQLPCSKGLNGDPLLPANGSQLPRFPDYTRKCKVSVDHTVDGIIVPVYVPKLVEKLLFTGCIHSQAAKYLSNPNYTKIGLATHEDCLVIALGTDTEGGSYSGGVSLVLSIGWLEIVVCGVLSLLW